MLRLSWRNHGLTLPSAVIVLLLAIVTYLPALALPFFDDDYHQIPLARAIAASGWLPLLHLPALRARATYMFLTWALDRAFGFNPFPFHAASVLLHALCSLLLFALGGCRWIGRPAAFWAACFFAIQVSHQEAVVWVAAAHDLLVFLFGMTALVCWVHWIESRRWLWYAAALGAILVAALSNESWWAFALLMAAMTLLDRRKRDLILLAPFLALAVAYVVYMFSTRVASGAADDRFELTGMKWAAVAALSLWRLLFPVGLAALAALLWKRRRTDRPRLAFALLWILLGIAPHTFLTYMAHLASRHTYLPGGGLALLVGIAASRLARTIPPLAFGAVCAIVLMLNVEALWVKKMAQFRERALPTELLKEAGRKAVGPVAVTCAPVPDIVAQGALASVGATAEFRASADQSPNCFEIEYRDRQGAMVRVNRHLDSRHGMFW